MSTKHTEGPWHALGQKVWQQSANCLIAECYKDGSVIGIPRTQVEANARLIAAAPDLLAALKELSEVTRKELEDLIDIEATRATAELKAASKQARAAIKKAEGAP